MKNLIANTFKIILCLSSLSGCSTIPQNYAELQRVAQEHHVYITDMEQFGVEDKWVVSLNGDCEDYALFIQKIIGGNLAIVRTVDGQSHMVLIVGDYVFDNMSPTVYLLKDMKHKLILILNN